MSSLALLSLLILLSISMVQLGHKEVQKSKHEESQATAEANARFALQIALSQLQLYSGKDLSISCRADLIDPRKTPLANAAPSLNNPYYTAIFQTEPVENDYNQSQYGKGVFLRSTAGLPAYLVSGNESFNLLTHSKKDYPEGYTTATTQLNPDTSVVLSQPLKDSAGVLVPTVPIKTDHKKRGRYAYWVSDENIKARINLEPSNSKPTPDQPEFNALRAPAALGIAVAGENLTKDFLADIPSPSKHLSYQSFAIHGKKTAQAIRQHQHDFTTHSQTVLCDLKHGGLKKNLTAAVNASDAEFSQFTEHTAVPLDTATPVFLYKKWSFPSEETTLSYSHYPGAPWELFRSYLRRPELEPDLTGERPFVLSHLGSSAHKLPSYWQAKAPGVTYRHPLDARLIRRSPTLLRFQLGIDYSIGYLGKVFDEKLGTDCHEYELRQHFIPSVSYWNPYNVDLQIDEKIEYHIYLDRNWTSGRHNTQLGVHLPHDIQWRFYGLTSDDKDKPCSWSSKQNGNASFFYPYHPDGNKTSKSALARCSFHVPPFRLDAGKTALFSTGSSSKELRYKGYSNTLKRLTSSTQTNHTFFTSNAKIRIESKDSISYLDAIPELEILSYPTQSGAQHTRLHATNSSSFHRINWNFSDITRKAGIRFIPTLINASDPLPQTDSNGTESPKITAVVIKKFPDIEHYTSSKNIWKTPSGSIDSNAYSAPWSLFYQDNASRYSAYGAHPNHNASFSSPPQYLTGILLGSSPLLQPDITPAAESFVGHSDRSSSGSNEAVQIALQRHEVRAFSPAHLSLANTAKWLSNYNAQQSNASATDALSPSVAIGNSFCSPHIPPSSSSVTVTDKLAFASSQTATQYDTSFRYNEALWDRYFLTGERANEITSKQEIWSNRQAKHLTPLNGMNLETWNDPHLCASQLMLEGGFNINSTSVEAWKVLLASTVGLSGSSENNLTPFPRLQYASSKSYSSAPSDPESPDYYNGKLHRALTPQEIQTLAEQIVIQNKLRGPYATLSQFINRSLNPAHHYRHSQLALPLTSDDICYEGAIQAAINQSSINGAFHTNTSQFPSELIASEYLVSDYQAGKINPKAFKYHTGYGAPGTLTQSDILNHIGHRLTARSDTFTIRAYGDCRDIKGRILAKAYCEAVVQRFPDYTNPNDPAESPPQLWELEEHDALPTVGKSRPNPTLSPLSASLGRRYKIIQFRWLHPEEI